MTTTGTHLQASLFLLGITAGLMCGIDAWRHVKQMGRQIRWPYLRSAVLFTLMSELGWLLAIGAAIQSKQLVALVFFGIGCGMILVTAIPCSINAFNHGAMRWVRNIFVVVMGLVICVPSIIFA